MVDGVSVMVFFFVYYEKDGIWGIEGYGVDFDLCVVDDLVLMLDNGDF